jgi:hypothetical protein
MWINAVVALLLVALAATSYRYSKILVLSESEPALAQKIAEIQDIEHLRKVALLLARDLDRGIQHTNKTVASGTESIAVLSLCFAVIAIVNWLSVLKHRRTVGG